jgi:hypothetical protein
VINDRATRSSRRGLTEYLNGGEGDARLSKLSNIQKEFSGFM